MKINIVNKEIESIKDSQVNIIIEHGPNMDTESLQNHIMKFAKNNILVYDGYSAKEIPINSIMYFYSEGPSNYCKTIKSDYLVKETLYNLENISPSFCRISKNCIANFDFIEEFNFSKDKTILITFKNGITLNVSRRKVRNVLKFLRERNAI